MKKALMAILAVTVMSVSAYADGSQRTSGSQGGQMPQGNSISAQSIVDTQTPSFKIHGFRLFV